MQLRLAIFVFLLVLAWGLRAAGEPATEYLPTRYSLSVNWGKSYSPTNDMELSAVSAAALFDYDRVWPHPAPEALRFKVEGSVGMSTAPRRRGFFSANMLALYFLDRVRAPGLRPYAEAGIGLIYADFQAEGQGLRINFNPQAGIGLEIGDNDGPPWFVALRLHHMSNGGLHEDNRGVNSVLMQIGRFF